MLHSSFIIPAFLFSLLSVAVSDLYKGDVCETREGAKGVCLPIQECPSMERELRAGRRPTKCGFEGHTPIVCCANQPPRIPPPETSGAAALTSAYTAGEGGKSDGPVVKAGGETESAEGERSEVRSKRKPGEAATYWCTQYRDKCKSMNRRMVQVRPIRRFKREVRKNNIPDYEDFGTSEKPWPTVFPLELFEEVHIVGGKESLRDEFPHMAAIGFGKQGDITWECGGSLISNTFVLTAAHCLIAQDGRRAEWVLLGTRFVSDRLRGYSTSSSGVIYHVIRRVRHPGYKRNSKYNDVALLELGPTLKYDDQSSQHGLIHPACLQVEWDSHMKMAVSIGWGRLGHGENPSSSLQKVQLNIMDNTICNETYDVEIRLSKLSKGVDETMICAGDLKGGKDTCQGDSGGPLQHETDSCLTHIVGVTSFGKICGFADSPAVYMRVTHFVPWIESIVWPEGDNNVEKPQL